MSDRVEPGSHRHFAIVGCGAEKQDTRRRVPARELYTSTYFDLKRQYAETVCDDWMIISAEHELLPPEDRILPYETTMADLGERELEGWTDSVLASMEEWTAWTFSNGVDEIVVDVLAGKDYVEPIRGTLLIANDAPDLQFRFPFDGTSGIGEQMGWLKQSIENADEQSSLEGFA